MFFTPYHSQVIADALRCLALAGVVCAAGWSVGARLPKVWSGGLLALVAAPLFTPALMVSYCYAPLGLRLTAMPVAHAIFYALITGLKLIPLAILARHYFPPALTAEGMFCAQLAGPRSAGERLGFALRSSGPVPWAIFSVVFLIAFTDFELASLLSIKTWTVMLFDAHAGGLAAPKSVGRMALPLAIELLAILPLLLLRTHRPIEMTATDAPVRPARGAMVVVAVIALAVTGWPMLRTLVQSLPGFTIIGLRDILGDDVWTSLATASAATGFLWLSLSLIGKRKWRVVLLAPGLLGALVLSLLILAILRSPGPGFISSPEFHARWQTYLNAFAETPIPLIIVEALLLAPLAVVLQSMLSSQRPREALYLARMAGSRRVLWDLAIQPAAGVLALLFLLAYFEFTAGSILAPLRLTPIFARLHNLAHYGQTAALSAMLLAAMIAPATLLALTVGTARLYARRDVR